MLRFINHDIIGRDGPLCKTSAVNHSSKLLLFTRYPEPGRTKTRLIPTLGPEGAALLQRGMTEYTLVQARSCGVELEVRYTGGTLEQMRLWLGEDLHFVDQGTGDLGERMQRAFDDHFRQGAGKVVVIGSDCPSNQAPNIQRAFSGLETAPCVVGPAEDGGYYLIGLRRPMLHLFSGMEWGCASVLKQTLARLGSTRVVLLPTLSDVDTPESMVPGISVIIPALNEETYINATLSRVQRAYKVEVLVVDGGSTDATRQMVPGSLLCMGGRAVQQNLGAERASGELLLFLHADTLLPEGWEWAIRETLAESNVVLGAFRFQTSSRLRWHRVMERLVNWRSRFLKRPYGDQALFMRREVFEQLGGFPDQPIMEDYALVRAARHLGRIVTLNQAATTSARRWEQHGLWKVTWVNLCMVVGYHLGVSAQVLARFYRRPIK